VWKKIKIENWYQPEPTSHTCDPSHETRMTASKKTIKPNHKQSNVEGWKLKKKSILKKDKKLKQ
jgi:hypothetical protein